MLVDNELNIMKKSLSVFSLIVWLCMLAAVIFATASLWRLAVLPNSYMLLICLALLVFWLLAGLLFWPGSKAKKDKNSGLVRRIMAWLLAIVTIGGCMYGVHVANKLDQTIEKITDDVSVTSIVAVYVLRNDPAQTIEDAADYIFGMTEQFDSANTRTAIADLRETFGSVQTESYDTVMDMVNALKKGGVNAIILNEAYPPVLEEIAVYEHFSEETRVLYEITLENGSVARDQIEEQGTDNGSDSVENFQPVNVTEEPFIIYISGSDTRSDMLTNSRSDVNIIAVVNPKTKQILLLNTPRDYYVVNPASIYSEMDKLTHCGLYGVDCSALALSGLYSVPINYYAQINFTGFETLIDAIGGITVHSDLSFTTRVGGVPIVEGDNYLDGYEALCFARERYTFEYGDLQRGQNQMEVISAIIRKLSVGTIIMNYSQIMDSLQGMFITNMTSNDISDLVRMQLSSRPDWNIKTFAVSGSDGYAYTYSMPGVSPYVMYQDPELVNRASELVRKVLNGDILTDADVAK